MTRFLVLVFLTLGFSANAAMQSDVIVYGATPGGFCAAIAAAREGVSVILLEPTGHVGGVNTGGLSFSDSNQTVRSTLRGLFEEWHSRIEKDYQDRGVQLPYQVSVKDQAHWTYEPHVAARVTHSMLTDAGVKVMTRRVLRQVEKMGLRSYALKPVTAISRRAHLSTARMRAI
jgi:ribulose 1,5-bisphosphate synthetase/thiazole synthase